VWREEVAVQFPSAFDEASQLKYTVAQVKAAQSRGVKTIVDPTVAGLGRDIAFIQKIVKETNIRVIVATGYYTTSVLTPYFRFRSVEHMADFFVKDIEEGIQKTGVRAAFLKCVTDSAGFTPDVEKVLRAVAKAHKKTGAPIMTHSFPKNRSGLKQQDIFKEEGVDLSRVLIGHSGDSDDIEYLKEIVNRGSFIGMDRYGGHINEISTSTRNGTVVKMCNLGYADRMMLSQDFSCCSDSFSSEIIQHSWVPGRSLTYLMDEVIPDLKKRGIKDSQMTLMTEENVKDWLCGIE
jgi:phosphotriesterase-related protein